MKKTNTDLGSKAQHGRPSSISSSGDQDFSLKKKKSLGSPNGNSPTKLLSKGQLSERLYPKPKPIRHNSSKSITTSFKPLSSEPHEDNNMFDLLSTPIDSKTILQYYKSNIKKRVQSLSSAIGVGNEFADITSSVAFKRAKAKIAKNKAATLLVDKLKLIMAKHFMKLVPTNLANSKRDLVLNGSESSNGARCEARFIHSIAGETSPRVEIMLKDSSDRNNLQSRRQLSDDNKLTKIFSPTGVNFQPSKCWTEADSPSESGHRRVLSNKHLPLKSEFGDFILPSTNGEDHSQKMASYKKHRDGKFDSGEQRTNKEYFTSLIEEDEFKSNSPSVWNSSEIASSLKESKRFFSNQADDYQLKANISHHKRESSLGYLDNQHDQKEKLKNRLNRPQSNTIKNHVLSKFVRLLKRSDGTYTAFRKIKDFAMSASSISYGEFKLDSPVIKTAVFPTFSNLSPKTRGFALNLDKIPEYEGETSNYYPQFSTKYTTDEKYKNALESMQKRTMGILHFERIYSQLVRKQYRSCFEKFSSKGDTTTLTLNEGLTVRSAVSIDQQSSLSRERKVAADSTSPKAGMKGGSNLHISHDDNTEKISSEGFNSRWQLENLESKNDVERGRKGIQDRDISALEGRLEKSLERKLDSKIQQNLDENLRGRLASELLKLFSQSITSFATKNEVSENRGSQTERGTESKFNLDPLQIGNFKRHIETAENEDRNFQSQRYSSVNEMMQYTPYFQKNVILPVDVNEDQKTVENISELKDYSAISHKEDYPSFNYGSPIKQSTKILDTSNLLSSIGRKSHEFSHSPSKIIPQTYQVEEERKSYSINALSLPSLTPVETHRIKSENLLKTSMPVDLYAVAFEKGKSEVAKRVRSFYLLEKVLNQKTNDLLWWGFFQLKISGSPRLNRFLGVQTEVVDQNRSLSAYSNLSVSTPINREAQQLQVGGLSQSHPMFGFGTLALSHRTIDRSGLDSSRFDITAKHVVMGKLIERLYIETMKFSFFKLHRTYVTKKYQYKPLNKNQTLNYLLFAKKVEKIYKNKIRGAFTQLCFKSTGIAKEKKFDLQKFLIGLGLKMKKSGFSRIRAHASKALHLKNSFGRMSALFNQKKLRILSEAFYFIASYGLVRKEYLINLSMMVTQLQEIRKSKLRDAFIMLKQGNSIKREALLKHILKQKNLKTRFLLKYAFLKWSRSASNLSVSIHHHHHTTEARRIGDGGNDKLMKAQLFIHLKNIFSSKALFHKFNAFSKLKHHTRNSEAALSLYTILNRKVWNSLKFGYDGIAKWDQDLDVTPRSMRKRKLERLSRIVKRRLYIGFASILSHSASVRQPLIKNNHKEGILRLCVIAEDMRQDFLLHGLKMIELYNIYNRNKKSLYINLGLKLYLLFDEKQKANKKYSLDMMFFQFEKNALRQRLLEKLSRKAHQKNLQVFFNKYKNEVVNLKLNYSMVNLAIKDIILAIEKLNKFQRACKALVFRKLSMLVWEKQQLTKESLQFASMIGKQAFQTNKALSSLGSIDFSNIRSNSGKPTDEKILRGVEHCSNLFVERKHEAFREIQYMVRAQNLADAMLNFESNVFQKLVYKRKFLSFAQIKYEHDKRNLRIQSHKSTGIFKLFKLLDKHTTFNKKTHFRRLKTLCDLKGQYLEEKLEQFSLYKTKIYFAKWRVALEKEIQRKVQTDTGLAKLEKLFFKKGFFLSQYAFDALIRNKDFSPKIPLLTYEQVITESSQPSPTRAVKTQPSSQKSSLKNSAVLGSAKSSTGTPKLASNRPSTPQQPNPEQSPSQNGKKASNRPSFGVSTGTASPRTKLPRQSSLMTQSTKNSPSQISTHSSSKNSTSSSQFSRSATLKK